MLFVCLFLVLVLVPSLVSNICPTRWLSLFLAVCRMLEVKELLTTVLEELEWLQSCSKKALIFPRNITKPFAHQMNVISSVISLRNFSFRSSFKQLICVVLVLGLVPSCLLVYLQF